MKLLVSSKQEIRNVFSKNAFQKTLIINEDFNVEFPRVGYWKAYITEAPVLCYFHYSIKGKQNVIFDLSHRIAGIERDF